jgi:hypothetical protein
MNRLITYGCSNTYGEGLEDCWTGTMWGPEPSKFAWPQLLADKMNLDCVNLGFPGVSNKYIWNKVLNTEFQKGDKVVILWTYFSRFCFFRDDGSSQRIMAQDATNKKLNKKTRAAASFYYSHFYSKKDSVDDNFLRITFIKDYLDNKGIENYHYTCEAREFFHKLKPLPWNKVNLKFIDWRGFPPALDNLHTGNEGQKFAANTMFNDINK